MKKIAIFNVSKFLAAARDAREDAVAMLGNPLVSDIRQAYRMVLDDADYTDVEYIDTARDASALRDELVVAAQKAYLDGATPKQIDMIVSLSIKANDYTGLGGGRLTKGDASRIIAQMLRA